VKGSAFDVDGFLEEPGRMAQVASVSPSAAPLLGSLWYSFQEGRFWFNSARSSALSKAAERGAPVAVIIDDFHPPDSIRQVRVRGPGRLEEHDADKVRHIYERYLGTDLDQWPPFFRTRVGQTDGWALWSVAPDSGMAVTSPGFYEEVYRWTTPDRAPFGRR
jgi:hypothetical protein